MEPFSAYQRRLLAFLGVATFFEGYDMFALAQVLPNLRETLHVSRAGAGWMLAAINAGTVIAYLLVRLADRIGRRRVLSITIVGYALSSLASAFAPNAWVFTALQCLARVFLIGEWAVAMVIAAEEYPAARRGTVLGGLQACSSLGGIVCAGVVPLLLRTPFGWRAVFAVGSVPLAIMAVARRGLRETRRFEARDATSVAQVGGMIDTLRSPSRVRILQLAAIWFLTYVCTQNAVTFWKEFAVAERGFSDAAVGGAITVAALASMPLVFLAGRLLDAVGRRRGGAVIYATLVCGVFGAYSLHGRAALTAALALAVFGSSAFFAVLNAYSTELFPTERRAAAFAWSNNLLGRIGYVLSPPVVGFAAERAGWGAAVRSTTVFPLLALVLLLLWMPETRGRELEDTAGA